MAIFKRVFENGAVEHRADSYKLGADAYTDENVPPNLEGLAWVLRDVEADPIPVPTPPPPRDYEAELDAARDLAEVKAVMKDYIGRR
ncbi:MAG TPA: hypothetical protein VFR55_04275 [Dehalococcoidia bacterium]|nr:hypothetical protein [Dehalococcoidia bacterium]